VKTQDRKPVFFTCDQDEERLTFTDPDEAIENYLDDLDDPLPEEVTVYGFAPIQATRSVDAIAGGHLEALLESLDEEYGDPGDRTYVAAVLAEYKPWACEQVSSEAVNVREWVKEHAPHWLEVSAVPAAASGEGRETCD
jgi:hypothetical protein